VVAVVGVFVDYSRPVARLPHGGLPRSSSSDPSPLASALRLRPRQTIRSRSSRCSTSLRNAKRFEAVMDDREIATHAQRAPIRQSLPVTFNGWRIVGRSRSYFVGFHSRASRLVPTDMGIQLATTAPPLPAGPWRRRWNKYRRFRGPSGDQSRQAASRASRRNLPFPAVRLLATNVSFGRIEPTGRSQAKVRQGPTWRSVYESAARLGHVLPDATPIFGVEPRGAARVTVSPSLGRKMGLEPISEGF
jgi:hypothetical protein